ncbi:MFS transporter [Ignatzschineria rhizosphaerae]|uniref:MFS transporter n=1 Tax=Ignatzschineria rhizosphaerae TaxID=2923279 RepID=A0ABY3WYV8_9GAMM|nr:YbfB/YjiJ family MFS transporter [Ignatzschineria rhizosphaerae]UNM95814.1 MFS transporter [Ignatzschineria rhizosphaerae]
MRVKDYLFSVAILTLGMGLGRFLYTGMMPVILEEGIFDFKALSYIASSNYFGYLFGALLFSFSLFHRPQYLKKSLILSVLSTALLLFLLSVLTSFPSVLMIRFLAGISSAAAIIFGAITVLKYFSSSFMTASFFSGVGLGILLGNELVNIALIKQYTSLQIWFYISLFAMMIALFIIFCHPKIEVGIYHPNAPINDDYSDNKESSIAKSDLEVKDPPFKLLQISWVSLIILYGFAGYGYIITATYLPVIAQSLPASKLTPHLWSLVGVGAIFSCYFWLYLEKKIGVLSALFWNLLTQSLFVLLSIFSDSLWLLVISAFGLGATFMGTTSLVMPLARKLIVPKTLNLVGLVTLTYGIGQILGPLVTSVIEAMASSLSLASISGSIALLIASLIVLYEKVKWGIK